MAKIKKGILGPISGNLGPITGSTWKDISYIKEKQKTTDKKKKRSLAQQAATLKFTFIQGFMVPFHPYLNIGFSRMATDKTEINVAFSLNYHKVFTGVWPRIAVNYALLKLSSGKLPGLPGLQILRTEALRLELSWERTTAHNASYDDQIMLVVYCPELKATDGFIGGTKRNALGCSFNLNSRFASKDVEVYLSVTSANRRFISESVYLGRLSI